MFFDDHVSCEFIQPETETLLVITAQKKINLFDWLKCNKSLLEKYVEAFGGIIVRGFGIFAISEFNKALQIFTPNLLDYTFRSTPRTKLGGKIYTSTEYPKNRSILLHNENSYSNKWPEKLYFFSAIVASAGGETPIADSRCVYKRIDKSIRNDFEEKGILYVRNYSAGFDLSWQDVFQTNQRDEVSNYCKENEIAYEWRGSQPELTTRQICQASLNHPVRNERSWFNQAHLFHSSALDKEEFNLLVNQLGEDNLPRNALYGDGKPIEREVIKHILDVYDKEKIIFQWCKGDIMILDNVLCSHGREPYTGERKVAVAMS